MNTGLLFRYIWIIAVLPKSAQFLILTGVAMYLLKQRGFRLRIDFFLGLVLAYAGVHLVSVLHFLMFESTNVGRLLAAANTIMIWVIACFFYQECRIGDVTLYGVGKSGFVNAIILFGLAITSRLAHILFGNLGVEYRFGGLLGYPTLVVSFVLMMYPFTICYIHGQKRRCKRAVYGIIYHAAILLPIHDCYSRSGYTLIILAMVLYVYMFIISMVRKVNYTFLPAVIGVVALAAIPGIRSSVYSVLLRIANMRENSEGSNAVRRLIYSLSLEKFKENPLLGFGVKVEGPLGYPLGSHSTYVGLLYNVGIVGALLFFGAFVYIILFTVKNVRQGRGRYFMLFAQVILLMMLYFLFEDMDGSDWQLCMWLSILGIAMNQGINWTPTGRTEDIKVMQSIMQSNLGV